MQTTTVIPFVAPNKAQALCDAFLTARRKRAEAKHEYERQDDLAKADYDDLMALPTGELIRLCEQVTGSRVEWLAYTWQILTGRQPDTTDPAWLVGQIIARHEMGRPLF